jgi:formylglycine-generating enzyme required for sulfatase activity
VSKLSAGSTSTEIFRWTADKCGDVKVKAVADANYVVTETSENNNDRTETVSINCLPSDIVIEDINWDPYNLVAGEPVDIAIIVRNNGKGKYVCPGNTRVDIKAIDKNNLIYGSAINEWVSTRWDIGDLEVGKRNTLIFKDFIFNIPYLAESLRVELISAGDGDVSNNFLEESIPQVRHNDDDFYKCMIDGVLICLTSGVKTTAALKKAGKVVDAIKQTFSSAQYYEELVEDLRQGQYEVFFSKIAKNKAEVIAQGDWGSGLIGAIKAKAAKAYEFFDVFKNIVETGIACANVFEFYVDILEGWIRGGEDGGISSSGVVGASLIYILVEDEYGKEAGYDQSGTKKEEIDGSLVFTCDHFKTVLIPGKFDNTKITVFGYDRDVEPGKTISLASEGETDSSFTLSIVESSKTIIYEDVPVNPQTIGTIEINEYNPEYYLDLDYDGDGTTDDSAKPDSIETFYEAEEVIFAEDFDTYATGSFPSSGSWNLKYNGRGDSYQIVDNSQSVSPPNSLKLEGEANWAATADHPLAETPDQVIYEVDVKVTQPGSSLMNYPDAAMGLANPNIGTWGTRYAGVIFGNAENRVIQPGNIPFNFDQWYHIKVEADMNNRVYDVWLDDQLIASDISTSSNGDYTDIRLEGGNNAHTRVWFDNVYVYRGHYPFQDPNGGLNGVPDENTITNTIGMEFVPIPAGEFEMGSPSDEQGRWSDEGPVHHVNIENAFHMGRYEVTQKQWREIMGDNPSHFKGDDLPVERVSWNDVQEFIRKLNEKEGTNKYRLPSEAEWEYACRAGTTTRYSFGDFESKLGDYAWYGDNSGDKTHPVGQKKPNSWGLYDMHGNVREWVQDSWHDDYNGAPADGSAWEGDGAGRAFHGGCWFSSAWNSRSAIRNHSGPRLRGDFLGFRLLKSL